MATKNLTVDRLREVVAYDSETGRLTWKARTGNRCKVGATVGNDNGLGYLQCAIDGVRLTVHQIAWAYVNGTWHDGHIDHVNGDTKDNRIANLRAVDCSTNLENQRAARSDNKSGYLGVAPHPCREGAFTAQIHVKGKKIHLGCFDEPKEAHQAYLEAKRKLHAGCTI